LTFSVIQSSSVIRQYTILTNNVFWHRYILFSKILKTNLIIPLPTKKMGDRSFHKMLATQKYCIAQLAANETSLVWTPPKNIFFHCHYIMYKTLIVGHCSVIVNGWNNAMFLSAFTLNLWNSSQTKLCNFYVKCFLLLN